MVVMNGEYQTHNCPPKRNRVPQGGQLAKKQSAGLGFRDLDDFAVLVLTAERADAVRQHALVAGRALGKALGLQVIVRAALGGAALRVASFGIRHGVSLYFNF
jgi:hypothetical protein